MHDSSTPLKSHTNYALRSGGEISGAAIKSEYHEPEQLMKANVMS